ncbi:outer membrane beta-barrel protein [Alkalimarinus alittae]|uniref:Outer membrane beta-barrel protein n=1 Tax=Alkalimarinus alittae TaxID=2961619 RepID=A0ABY6N798_9ALTE|nr:outer membrane beta-barrel protein [Alkalimarinus alittae]UZE97964.1 outer membrane beta-barrel protein [Alkalimarinus alittae]
MDKNNRLAPLFAKLSWVTPSVLLSVSLVAGVSADPGTLELGLTTEYTDNARKSASGEVEDYKNSASIRINKSDQFGRLDSSIVGELEYYTYANDTYSNNLDSNLLWDASYNIRPGTLTWGISDELSEVTIDSSEADTPDNRTTRNIFTTGPSYTKQLSKVDTLNLTAEYQRLDFKTEGDDNDRYRFISSLAHQFTAQQQASINYDWTKTLFGSDRELYRNELSLSYSYSYLTYYFNGSYGITHLKGSTRTTTQETDSNTWNATLRTDLTRTSNLSLTFNRELNDTLSGFDQRYEDTVINISTTSVVLLTEWSVNYQKTFSNNASFDGKIFHNISDYLIDKSSEERNGVELGYSYPLYSRLTLGFNAEYEQIDYDPSAREDEKYDLSIGTSYEYIRDLFFTVEIARTEQESNSPTNEYQENRVMLGVRYFPSF